MNASKELIEGLNQALAGEIVSINQYTVHAEMDRNWGFPRLHALVEKRGRDEMKHAERLIERIITLGGAPAMNEIAPVRIGGDVVSQISNDLAEEQAAVVLYNELVRLAVAEKDKGTEDLFASILHDEEEHLSTLEIQTSQIARLGVENFLTLQAQ